MKLNDEVIGEFVELCNSNGLDPKEALARALLSPLVAIQFHLQTQIFDVQMVSLTQQRGDHGLQGFLILG